MNGRSVASRERPHSITDRGSSAAGAHAQPAHRALYNSQPHTKLLTMGEVTLDGELRKKSVLIALIFPFVEDLDCATTQHKPPMASLPVCCRTDYGGAIIAFSAPWWPICPIYFS